MPAFSVPFEISLKITLKCLHRWDSHSLAHSFHKQVDPQIRVTVLFLKLFIDRQMLFKLQDVVTIILHVRRDITRRRIYDSISFFTMFFILSSSLNMFRFALLYAHLDCLLFKCIRKLLPTKTYLY